MCGSNASTDSTIRGLCSPIVFTLEKNMHINGPVQFKPVLFKDQLYFLSRLFCPSPHVCESPYFQS